MTGYVLTYRSYWTGETIRREYFTLWHAEQFARAIGTNNDVKIEEIKK